MALSSPLRARQQKAAPIVRRSMPGAAAARCTAGDRRMVYGRLRRWARSAVSEPRHQGLLAAERLRGHPGGRAAFGAAIVAANDPSNEAAARITGLGSETLLGFRGFGFFPGMSARGGDVWFDDDTAEVGDSFALGRNTYRLVLHELGHPMGIKHGHETGAPANTAMIARTPARGASLGQAKAPQIF